MAANDYYSFVSLEGETTVAIAMGGVQLRKLKDQVTKVNVIKSLSFLIANFNNNFNARGKLNEQQIIVLAGDLFDRFSFESLEDVMLMFKYARQGKIGDGKDFKLDSQTIFHKWVPEYLELKANERELSHNKKKGELSGMANFNWDKENLDKFEVSEKEQLAGKNFGSRVKEIFTTEHLEKPKLDQVLKPDYHQRAKADVVNHSTENLQVYLNAEKKSVVPDESMIKIVELELKSRK
jgi:hypothetical protein